jgi:hypothetical protein
MTVDEVKAYWKHWAPKEQFYFLDGSTTFDEGTDDNPTTEKPPSSPYFAIDENIPLPCECYNPSAKTNLLQTIAPMNGPGKTFVNLVKVVDTLEVSLDLLYNLMSQIISGNKHSQPPPECTMAIYPLVMG